MEKPLVNFPSDVVGAFAAGAVGGGGGAAAVDASATEVDATAVGFREAGGGEVAALVELGCDFFTPVASLARGVTGGVDGPITPGRLRLTGATTAAGRIDSVGLAAADIAGLSAVGAQVFRKHQSTPQPLV